MTDTAQLRALLAKMTRGEWRHTYQEGEYSQGEVTREGDLIAIIAGANYGQWRDVDDNGESEFQANAAGIVALVNAAEPMLDELERLRAEVARQQRLRDQYREAWEGEKARFTAAMAAPGNSHDHDHHRHAALHRAYFGRR